MTCPACRSPLRYNREHDRHACAKVACPWQAYWSRLALFCLPAGRSIYPYSAVGADLMRTIEEP